MNKIFKKNFFFWCYWLKNLVCVDFNELYGIGYVFKELEKFFLVIVFVIIFVNWWNVFIILLFLIFMFDSMGIFIWFIVVLVNIGLIKLGNVFVIGAVFN